MCYRWRATKKLCSAKETDMLESDDRERELRFVMQALCRSLDWDIETDNEGNYVIYPGIRDPYYSRGNDND